MKVKELAEILNCELDTEVGPFSVKGIDGMVDFSDLEVGNSVAVFLDDDWKPRQIQNEEAWTWNWTPAQLQAEKRLVPVKVSFNAGFVTVLVREKG